MADCELLHDGLLDEPANALSSLAYVAAGAEVVTANTFRTHQRSLQAGGVANARQAATELTAQAVALARSAAGDSAWVAGSQAPLMDCYLPRLRPDAEALDREHQQMAENLAAAGVGTLGLVDFDTIDLSNLQRQVLFGTRDVGKSKLDIAAARANALCLDIERRKILRELRRPRSGAVLRSTAHDYHALRELQQRYCGRDRRGGLGALIPRDHDAPRQLTNGALR